MSGPKRLAGRCHQARSPQSTYERVIQTEREASTSGSPRSLPIASFVSAKASDEAAAAPPANAKAQITASDGPPVRPISAPPGSAVLAMSLLLSDRSRRQNRTNLSHA